MTKRSDDHKGLLFDDRGNRMSPSFSTKRGVRYRFYVSSAILTGRKSEVGSVSRVSAPGLESSIVSALRERFAISGDLSDQDLIDARIEGAVLGQKKLLISLKTGDANGSLIELARSQSAAPPRARIENDDRQSIGVPDVSMIHAIARAHLWVIPSTLERQLLEGCQIRVLP